MSALPQPRTTVTLPPGWDPGRDLAVVVGRGAAALCGALAAAGQRRILLWRDGAAREPLPAGVRAVEGGSALFAALLSLGGARPARYVVLGTGAPDVTPALRARVARHVEDGLLSARLQAATVAALGPTWLLQGIANLPALAASPSIAPLRGAFRGVPCVLVAPGPSLSRNLQLLPSVRGRALVISGTHALGALRTVGVAPDLAIVADPGELGRHYDAIDVRGLGGLVVGATCAPQHFELPVARRFSFASNGAIDDWIFAALGEDASLATGGSVSCSALSLALALGCDPIVLVGQDLAFSEGRYYAAESLDGDAALRLEEDGAFSLRKPSGAPGPGVPQPDGTLRFTRDRRSVELPGYHGGTVLSSESFRAFRAWFQAVAELHRGSVRLVNATEGGADIPGMEHTPLAQVLQGLAGGLEVGPRLDRAAGVVTADRAARLRAHARGLAGGLAPCRELALRCARLTREAATRDGALRELGRLERRLQAALAPLGLFALVAQEEIVRAEEQARKARSLAENLAAARRLYEVVVRACALLETPLERAVSELERLR